MANGGIIGPVQDPVIQAELVTTFTGNGTFTTGASTTVVRALVIGGGGGTSANGSGGGGAAENWMPVRSMWVAGPAT